MIAHNRKGPGATNTGPNQKNSNTATHNGNFPLGLERSNAHCAIEVAKFKHPQLCRYGIWSEPCADDFSVDGVMTALIYLRRWPKHPEPRWSSYFLKHHAENWGRANDLEPYIGNGEMIAACVYLGLPIRYGNGPNVAVGVNLPRDYVRRAGWGEVD